ncbi:PEP-CTERM sorting domain-containing protein [Duganella sp. BuS-21]|uniref:PEP-CTERM sorting domain-containing protein n=1 Tax=Duganella sp. BuS-21 TaxID=2943848 RepID=UPI0035A679A3
MPERGDSAQATTLDFDAATVTGQLPFANLIASYAGTSDVEDGFTFTSTGPGPDAVLASALSLNAGSYSLGETLLGTTTPTSNSGLFNITALNLLRFPLFFSTTVTFIGTKADLTTTVSQKFKFTNNNWGTLNFGTDVVYLSSLKWTQTSVYVVDKLNVTAVPEPETYAMLLAGLAARRRKQA